MPAFLFELELPPFDEALVSRIPEHRERINTLFSEGRILSYSVAEDRSRIWCIVEADGQQDAMKMVTSFPLQEFFVDISYYPLLFHQHQPTSLPGISLN